MKIADDADGNDRSSWDLPAPSEPHWVPTLAVLVALGDPSPAA